MAGAGPGHYRLTASATWHFCATSLKEGAEMESEVFEGTARDIRTRLAGAPDDERVRVIVGRPSLTMIARRLQAAAASNGMTGPIHDALMQSLKHDR